MAEVYRRINWNVELLEYSNIPRPLICSLQRPCRPRPSNEVKIARNFSPPSWSFDSIPPPPGFLSPWPVCSYFPPLLLPRLCLFIVSIDRRHGRCLFPRIRTGTWISQLLHADVHFSAGSGWFLIRASPRIPGENPLSLEERERIPRRYHMPGKVGLLGRN